LSHANLVLGKPMAPMAYGLGLSLCNMKPLAMNSRGFMEILKKTHVVVYF